MMRVLDIVVEMQIMLLLLTIQQLLAFMPVAPSSHSTSIGLSSPFPLTSSTVRLMATSEAAYGEYSVDLIKPLGIILEERSEGVGGVQVNSISQDGAAFGVVTPGDVLTQINGQDVSTKDFDSIMDLLTQSPEKVALTWTDGLGSMDIAPNLLKQFKSTEEAIFVDQVVRAAVKRIRRSQNTQLGDLINVEIILGAGVREKGNKCLVRFFALFSTDGVTSYSCNVSATGIKKDGIIDIVALSCAKDEGWGQTIDLIAEKDS